MAGTDTHKLTFTRDERLKSRKRIDELFRLKQFFQNSTLRIYYIEMELNSPYPAQFGFSVPKKLFPHATDRNRLKRLMRESVRHAKPVFYKTLQEQGKQLALLLSYQSKTIHSFEEVNAAVLQLLQKLVK